MKKKPVELVEKNRLIEGDFASDASYGNNGCFCIPFSREVNLNVVASDEMGWEHVSVSLPFRTPEWREMCYIKDLFWEEEETVIQYHPAASQYVNNHPYCLHLWKPTGINIPLPPTLMVGIK